jgi:hypothetical protein
MTRLPHDNPTGWRVEAESYLKANKWVRERAQVMAAMSCLSDAQEQLTRDYTAWVNFSINVAKYIISMTSEEVDTVMKEAWND